MPVNVQTLLDNNVFKDYTIVSGEDNLLIEIESMSILETPDFKNYIIENSLILTTFYPIKTDITATMELLKSLKKFNTAGLIVKIHRYIDDIPPEVIEFARALSYPIITLDYDANLSTLFNTIMSEIQVKDFRNYSLEYSYSNLLSKVYENPSTKTLMDTVASIDGFDFLIHNLEDNTLHATTDTIMKYYKKYGSNQSLIQRDADTIYYSEDVIYEEKPVYRMVFNTSNDKRHILHNFIEIFKLMIVIIYQKKLENSLRQNRFLYHFLSDRSTKYTMPELIENTKKYHWDISFPITLALFNISKNSKPYISPTIIDYINTLIVNKFHIRNNEFRYTYLDENLVFIINTNTSIDLNNVFTIVYNILENKFPKYRFKLAYSSFITNSKNIPEKYELIASTMTTVLRQNLSLQIFTEEYIELINLMKKLDHKTIANYVNHTIQPLLDYEKEHNIPLVDTLFEYITTKFNLKKTSENLFIHYNTLRYRIKLISKLGIDVSSSNDYFSIYFALFLYKNLQIS